MPGADSASGRWWRGAVGVLVGAFLFNVGQGVLRPTLPLYLRAIFAANYRMVTAIPTVFGLGKWVASLPTGHLLGRWGRRPLMVGGLLVIAFSDVASIMTPSYPVFLSFRALAGVGWAMFGTVATTVMVDLPAVQRRGRAVSVLMMSETLENPEPGRGRRPDARPHAEHVHERSDSEQSHERHDERSESCWKHSLCPFASRPVTALDCLIRPAAVNPIQCEAESPCSLVCYPRRRWRLAPTTTRSPDYFGFFTATSS